MSGQYSNQYEICRFRSGWAIAHYNPHHSNWLAGNAYAPTAQGAVDYANSDTVTQYPSYSAALREIIGNDISDFADPKKYNRRQLLIIAGKLGYEIDGDIIQTEPPYPKWLEDFIAAYNKNIKKQKEERDKFCLHCGNKKPDCTCEAEQRRIENEYMRENKEE